MSQQKQPTSKSIVARLFSRRSSALLLLVVFGMGMLLPAAVPRQVQAHHAQECSDVFTPLSSAVTNGVANNKDAYLQIQGETGVPWEMLAAIHYRETNFGRTNPGNGQGIFQFVNGEGGPYPPGPVDETEFRRQLRFMANKLQSDYVWRGSVPRDRRQLQPNETNVALVKDTLMSYNGRAGVYADQAVHFGYNRTNQPYEGSPYVMNRFDCQRARMGIITRDYGSMDGTDTRYGAFTIFARLRGDAYWRSLLPFYTEEINMSEAQSRVQTIVFNGQIYVFYYDALQQVLRMATQPSGSGWQFSILDGTTTGGNGRVYGNTGSSLAVTTHGNSLQLFYYDKSRGNLRHAWSTNGTNWQFENLDGDIGSVAGKEGDIGLNPSVTSFAGTLQLLYYDRTNGNLRHAWADPSGWKFENLDGDIRAVAPRESNVGLFSTITGYGNSLQAFYYDQGTGNLRHAWTTSTGWRFENLDGDEHSVARHRSDVGIIPSVTVMGDALQLFYYDNGQQDLRHAWTTTSHPWRFEDLDGDATAISRTPGDVGITSAVMPFGNSLQTYYYDKGHRNLRHAWAGPTGWRFENLDGDPGALGQWQDKQNVDTGIHVGVTQFGNSLQTYYYNRTTGSLRHAWADQNGWHFEDLGPTVIY